jgi:hypothetical protein
MEGVTRIAAGHAGGRSRARRRKLPCSLLLEAEMYGSTRAAARCTMQLCGRQSKHLAAQWWQHVTLWTAILLSEPAACAALVAYPHTSCIPTCQHVMVGASTYISKVAGTSWAATGFQIDCVLTVHTHSSNAARHTCLLSLPACPACLCCLAAPRGRWLTVNAFNWSCRSVRIGSRS